MLYTDALEETLAFYTKKLGFICNSFDKEVGWALVRKDNVEIMFSTPNNHLPFEHSNFTGSFYILVNDVDELWSNLEKQVTICYPLEAFDYGLKEFAIYDNNNYLIQFGQMMRDEG